MPKSTAKNTTRTSAPVEPARFLGCITSGVIHPPLAIRIWKGPKAFFVRCGSCRSSSFLSPVWKPEMGMTRKEAEQRGFAIAAV